MNIPSLDKPIQMTFKQWYEFNKDYFEGKMRCEVCIYKRYIIKSQCVTDRVLKTALDFADAVEMFGDYAIIKFYGHWDAGTVPKMVVTIVKQDGFMYEDLAG